LSFLAFPLPLVAFSFGFDIQGGLNLKKFIVVFVYKWKHKRHSV
jgi:hypothetical protein